jgi:hypothetical protein
MAMGLLVAGFDSSPVAEDEFDDWYDTEHMPERVSCAGFGRCERWVAADNPKISIATYDLDSLGVLKSEPYLKIGGANLSVWSKRVTAKANRICRFEAEQLPPGNAKAPEGAGGMLLYAMNVAPEAEKDFNAWYDEEHIPALGAVPGVLAARRFRGTSGNRKYVALYHLATPNVQDSAEWKAARESDWTSRLKPHFRDFLRLVLRRYARA